MASARLYPKLLDLVRKWPENSKTSEKTLGNVLRALVAKHYPEGSVSTSVTPEIEAKVVAPSYEAFNNLSNNVHFNKYPRKFPGTSATGLKQEDVDGNSIIDVLDVIRYRAERVGTIRDPGIRDKLAAILPGGKKSD